MYRIYFTNLRDADLSPMLKTVGRRDYSMRHDAENAILSGLCQDLDAWRFVRPLDTFVIERIGAAAWQLRTGNTIVSQGQYVYVEQLEGVTA